MLILLNNRKLDGTVTALATDEYAMLDREILGVPWRIEGHIGSAIIADRPELVSILRDEGYDLDIRDYLPGVRLDDVGELSDEDLELIEDETLVPAGATIVPPLEQKPVLIPEGATIVPRAEDEELRAETTDDGLAEDTFDSDSIEVEIGGKRSDYCVEIPRVIPTRKTMQADFAVPVPTAEDEEETAMMISGSGGNRSTRNRSTRVYVGRPELWQAI